MPQNTDILLRYLGTDAKIRVKGDQVSVKLRDKGSLQWASEKFGGIDSGNLSDLPSLIDSHDELRREGEFSLMGLEFSHEGKNRSLLAKLNERPSLKDNGNVILRGKVVNDVDTEDGIDHVDRVGSSFSDAHNKHNDGEYFLRSGDVELHLDTYTDNELTSVYLGADEIPGSYKLGEQDTSLRYALSGYSGDSSSGSQLSGKVIDFNKDYSVGPATLNLTASVSPTVDVTFDSPDSWWDLFDRDEYAVIAEIKLDWDASTTLTTGADSGKFPLLEQTWEGPSVSFPIGGGLSASFGSGLDFTANLTLPGLADSYKLGASQTVGKKFTVKTSGVTTDDLSTSVKTEIPSFDAITGLGLDATAAPYLDLQIGMLVPKIVPSWGGKSLADVTGKFSVPVKFDLQLAETNSFTIGVGAELSATVNALTFKDSWKFSKELANGSIYEWTSPNLIG